jgi:hypothetical protein
MRIVAVPAATFYKQRGTLAQIKPVAEEAFGAIVRGLTLPISSGEASPKPKRALDKTIRISADDYELALEKFNEEFLENHWSDGLPIVAPTLSRVQWMLSGTRRSPGETIGIVAPKNGTATVEKIAVNAVMAGAKPEYLPVIIAAMEALTDKNFNTLHVMTSTGSFNLVIAVTGPMAKEIGMNSGIGYWGYGWRANSTIGRAVRLCMINLGHLWPGENDMALVGRPSSHTFYVVAENQDDSPWPPYHVTQGFKPEDSCVTVSTVGGYGTYGVNIYGGGAVGIWTADSVLNRIIEEIRADQGPLRSMSFGSAGEPGPRSGSAGNLGSAGKKYVLLIHPEFAQELQRLGYTRDSLSRYLSVKTGVPYEDLKPEDLASIQRAIESGSLPANRASEIKAALKPGGRVPLYLTPEDNHIIVAGGIPGYTLTMSYNRGAHETKLIRGATRTQAGSGSVSEARH